MLATSLPSHGAQASLYVIAIVSFLTAAIVAWFTPMLNRAVALIAAGLVSVTIVWAWIQIAAT